VVDEVRINIAAGTIKVADWSSKVRGWGWRSRGDGCRDGVAGEEPDFHEFRGPLHGVDTAAVGIEAIAIAGLIIASCGATCCSSGADSAVVAIDPTSLILKLHGAVGSSVSGDLVGSEGVDAFDDVEFSVSGPVGVTQSPECRPYSTDGARHVFDVCKEEAVVVVDITLETY
jgi:hypothetical protein